MAVINNPRRAPLMRRYAVLRIIVLFIYMVIIFIQQVVI
jgi:hypothetical protein